jgi:PadR family transcriptional regulator, regulatory protein PadR
MVQGKSPFMTMKKTNPDFLNGVPELLILKLLHEQPMHGYDLVQAIKASSGGNLEFGEGCVYPILHRLEAQKYLASRRELAGGRNRIVYRITKQGQQRLAQAWKTWEQVVAGVALVLQGGEHGQPSLA